MNRLKELLNKMTLSEKIGQLTMSGNSIYNKDECVASERLRQGKVGAVITGIDVELANKMQREAVENTRLGIPLMYGFDVIHGFRTIFPMPLAESCSWDEELAEKTAAVAAKEARASGIHITFAPMVDVSRDARWGRYNEGAGEDTYLNCVFAKAKVRGFQGDDISRNDKLGACVKHFVGYGAVEGGIDYNNVDLSGVELYNYYIPPFKAAINEGAVCVMSAFVTLNGEPCVGSEFVQKKLLRNECKFDGVTISDFASPGELTVHGYAENLGEAAEICAKAMLDVEMEGKYKCYYNYLEELVRNNIISMELINSAVMRVLRLKEKLGLFENPYFDKNLSSSACLTQENIEMARKSARSSVVMLKNNAVLPIDKTKRIAIIGNNAHNRETCISVWEAGGKLENVVTFYDGLKNAGYSVVYAKGCNGNDDDVTGFDEAVKAAESADVIVAVIGEERYTHFGESGSRANINIPGVQAALIERLSRLEKPLVTLINSGRPLAIREVEDMSDAVLFAPGGLGQEAGNAFADILSGIHNPDAKLTFTMPYSSGAVPSYYNHYATGRPASSDFQPFCTKYSDSSYAPLHQFGYGIGYSFFEYTNIKTDKAVYDINEEIKVSADIRNAGEYDGFEIVQLYIKDEVSRPVRPVCELKGHQKIFIEAGKRTTVEFVLPVSDMGFFDNNGNYSVQTGIFEIRIGKNSTDYLVKKVKICN